MPSPITSFKSKLSSIARPGHKASAEENVAPSVPGGQTYVKLIGRKPTAAIPKRSPLAPTQHDRQNQDQANTVRSPKADKTAQTGTRTNKIEQPKSSPIMKRAISSVLSNAIRHSSTRNDIKPVRTENGSFMPPMHLTDRKGSRYAQSNVAAPAQANEMPLKQAPVIQSRPTRNRIESPKQSANISSANTIQGLPQGLRPLRLVNKVLSDGHPVANLVSNSQHIEVKQRVVEDKQTNERLVVVEMRIVKNGQGPAGTITRTSARRDITPKKSIAREWKENYPLRRRSMPYKPVSTSTKTAQKPLPSGNTVVANEHAKNIAERRQPCDRVANKGRNDVPAPAKAELPCKEEGDEPTSAAENDTVARGLSHTSLEMSSPSTSLASTPTPSPSKAKPKPLATRLPVKSSKHDADNSSQLLVAPGSDEESCVKKQEQVTSKKNVKGAISSLFSRSSLIVKKDIVLECPPVKIPVPAPKDVAEES